MKKWNASISGFSLFPLLLLLVAPSHLSAQPEVSSWQTDRSVYARAYLSDADVPNNPVTSWVHPDGGTSQPAPTYAGIHELSSTANWVYIRTTGLGGHLMGPWYRNTAHTGLFPNFPNNQAAIYRMPRQPGDPAALAPKPLTRGGPIGYFVDGVAMFDSRDAFSFNNATGADVRNGPGRWNRDAYVNERVTFDAALAHQAGGQYHYHSSPPALRHRLGDSVDYDPASNTYTENFNGEHSPILAWVRDGLPLYGPYGYSDPNDPNSPVRRMRSGYQLRAGLTTRNTWPAWASRIYGALGTSFETGPAVSAAFPLGRYMEDKEYKGDQGLVLGTDFDLNDYHVRFCVTPEFPGGTWAYFTCIDADGTPAFPYNIGRVYFGDPRGGLTTAIPAADDAAPVTVHFEGGPESDIELHALRDQSAVADNARLRLESTEGGIHDLQKSLDLLPTTEWVTVANNLVAGSDDMLLVVTNSLVGADLNLYRACRTGVMPFDDRGFVFSAPPSAENNILLLIVDDWAIDSSPIDNNPGLNPGTTFPTMQTLQSLAADGVRFTQGYAQPVCSPTRAAILTGRQGWRTGVGSPMDSLQAGETTLPRAFAAAGSNYALGSFGKWHLGGGDSGYSTLGGWPHFVGITRGGVQDFFNWSKNVNGANQPNTTTYTTTDQVNEATAFIDTQTNAGNPWFVWIGFNAPHTPFHEPPAALLQGGTGSTDRDRYEKALEALDTEIGRLLQSVDRSKTTIILVGDNGTPAQTVQAPFGPTGRNGHSKGDLYEGGIHVPFVISGPDVNLPAGSTSDRLVHVVDLFPTILDLAGVTRPGTGVDATSLLPILQGNDNVPRGVVTEVFNVNNPGRSIRLETDPAFPGSDPDYKLIIFGDPTSSTDIPRLEFYHLPSDPNEFSPLNLNNLTPVQQAAFDALLAKDQALGGAFSDAP